MVDGHEINLNTELSVWSGSRTHLTFRLTFFIFIIFKHDVAMKETVRPNSGSKPCPCSENVIHVIHV